MASNLCDFATITATLASLRANFEVFCHTRDGTEYHQGGRPIAYVRCCNTPLGKPDIVDKLCGGTIINPKGKPPYWEWCCFVGEAPTDHSAAIRKMTLKLMRDGEGK